MSPLINGIKYLQPAWALFSGCGFRALPKDLCSTNILGLKWASGSTCKQHIEISKFIDFPLDGLKEEEEAFWYYLKLQTIYTKKKCDKQELDFWIASIQNLSFIMYFIIFNLIEE